MPAGLGNRGDLSRRRQDRGEGVRLQDPTQPWPPLPLEPRPPAQPPAAPRLPGAGPSTTAAASARSRSRIFPPPPGAVTRESAAARPARPGPPLGLQPQFGPALLGPWVCAELGERPLHPRPALGVPFHHAHVSDEKTEVTLEIHDMQS